MTVIKICQQQKQLGAAMMMSLIFLAAMSIVAVATMQSSSLDQKIAVNTQNYNRAFQAAESAIAEAMRNSGIMNAALAAGVDPANPQIVTVAFGDDFTAATAEVSLMAKSSISCPNYSSEQIKCFYFKAVGRGWLKSNTNVQAVNEQGFYRKVREFNSFTE